MDPAIDVQRRINETMAQAAKQYMDNQRARAGSSGRSPDGSVEVILDGLGDLTDVRVRADGVPQEIADRLAGAFKTAWQAAARSVAQASVEESTLAQRPGMIEFVREQIVERYGPPPEQADETGDDRQARRPARRDDSEDEDFGGKGFLRPADQ